MGQKLSGHVKYRLVFITLVILIIVSFFIPTNATIAESYEKPLPSYPKTGSNYTFGVDHFLGGKHTGIDLSSTVGTEVKAILDGVVYISKEASYYGSTTGGKGGVIVIRHENVLGEDFYAIYGHLNREYADRDGKVCSYVNQGQTIKKGTVIGTIRPYDGGVHLHFGININCDASEAELLKGASSDVSNWRDPVKYMQNFCNDPPSGWVRFSDNEDISTGYSVNQYKGEYDYIGSLDEVISRVDIGDDNLVVILYNDTDYKGDYIAFKGKGIYYLNRYSDSSGNNFNNRCKSFKIYTTDDPRLDGIAYNMVISDSNSIIQPVYAAEGTITTETPSDSSLNLMKQLLGMTASDAVNLLGGDYSYDSTGAEGSLDGYKFPSRGITLSYSGDPESAQVTDIYCWEGTSIGAVTVGMSTNEITGIIGEPVEIIPGDEEIYPYDLYDYQYGGLQITFIQPDGEDDPTFYAIVSN